MATYIWIHSTLWYSSGQELSHIPHLLQQETQNQTSESVNIFYALLDTKCTIYVVGLEDCTSNLCGSAQYGMWGLDLEILLKMENISTVSLLFSSIFSNI